MKEKFYSAKYDRAFKEVFLKEKNKDLLKELLEKILSLKISKIEIKKSDKLSGNIHIKEKRLDALLDTDIGKINIEVNSKMKDYVHPRNLSYICNEYSSHTLVGKEYDEEVMIMQINLTYGMSKKEKIMREYRVMDEEGKMFVRNFKIIEVNMEYYLNLWYDFIKKGVNKSLIEDNQLLIMLGLEEEDLEMLSKSYKKVNRFMSEIEEVNKNPEFRFYITEEEDREFILNSEIKSARKKGLEQGIKEGMKKGMKEGIKEGKEKGIIERNKEIAKNMLESNVPISDISKYTGLTEEEIKKI